MLKSVSVCLITAATALPAAAGPPTGDDLLDKSLSYHDPGGRWRASVLRLSLEETRPEGSFRPTTLLIDYARGRFKITTQREEAEIRGMLDGASCELRLNGSARFSSEERDRFRLTCERLEWLRNYYVYLWGLPMKLLDRGTRIDSEVRGATFQKRPVWVMRVTYDEKVGKDTWHFYFDRRSYALVGYRFDHDEAKGDGETIILEGEVRAGELRLPKTRAWFTNAENRFLGTDTLASLEVLSN
jgi:hypothetical protein